MATKALDAARNLFTNMSPNERAEMLGLAVDDFAGDEPGIRKTPGVCGGAACIRGMRIPVWLLEQARRLGTSESELLIAYPDLTAADLVRAWAYVAAHTEEVEEAIQHEEAA